jgi:hypothetical protein
MIAKYDSVCVYCRKPTVAGVDEYDPVKKKGWHRGCLFSPGNEDQEALAERLGFRPVGQGDFELWRQWPPITPRKE